MAYTPINWQTGDTITADKLNRCDNGWAVESTQLFSETVTTADDGEGNYAALAYDGSIDTDTIIVTFDGTEYVCPRIDAYGQYFYGGFNQGLDFTTYPFVIASGGGNDIYTETASTHTIAVAAQTIVTSSDFTAAVATAAPLPLLRIVQQQTTWQQVYDAMAAGKIAYYFYDSGDSASTWVADEAYFNDSSSRYVVSCNGGNMALSAGSSSGALLAD